MSLCNSMFDLETRVLLQDNAPRICKLLSNLRRYARNCGATM
jgi:hypothetical protein